jgi:hypothetical protein
MPVAAFTAGIVTGVAVYLLAYRRGLDSYRLVLAGLGISGLAASLTTWILTLGDVTSAAQALTWMTLAERQGLGHGSAHGLQRSNTPRGCRFQRPMVAADQLR